MITPLDCDEMNTCWGSSECERTGEITIAADLILEMMLYMTFDETFDFQLIYLLRKFVV